MSYLGALIWALGVSGLALLAAVTARVLWYGSAAPVRRTDTAPALLVIGQRAGSTAIDDIRLGRCLRRAAALLGERVPVAIRRAGDSPTGSEVDVVVRLLPSHDARVDRVCAESTTSEDGPELTLAPAVDVVELDRKRPTDAEIAMLAGLILLATSAKRRQIAARPRCPAISDGLALPPAGGAHQAYWAHLLAFWRALGREDAASAALALAGLAALSTDAAARLVLDPCRLDAQIAGLTLVLAEQNDAGRRAPITAAIEAAERAIAGFEAAGESERAAAARYVMARLVIEEARITGDSTGLDYAQVALAEAQQIWTRDRSARGWCLARAAMADCEWLAAGTTGPATPALARAADLYGQAVEAWPTLPDWGGSQLAMTADQDQLGRLRLHHAECVARLGVAEGAAGRLAEGIALLRTGLEVAVQRDSEDLAQRYRAALGSALLHRGLRSGEAADLDGAVDHLEQATRAPAARHDQDASLALGLAHAARHAAAGSRSDLESAAAAYRRVIEDSRRGMDGSSRTALLHEATLGLTHALVRLARLTGGSEHARDALAAARALLSTPESRRGQPTAAEALALSADALRLASAHAAADGASPMLEEAAGLYRRALAGLSRESTPLLWGRLHKDLGETLAEIGARDGNSLTMEQAATAYRQSLEESHGKARALTLQALGQVILNLALVTSAPRRIEEARRALSEAYDLFQAEGQDAHAAAVARDLTRMESWAQPPGNA